MFHRHALLASFLALFLVCRAENKCPAKPSKAVIGYILPSNDANRQKISSVDGSKLTHLYYAFGIIEEDGSVSFPGAEDKALETKPDSCPSGQTGPLLGGQFGEMYQLRTKYPHLRVVLAIGGWLGSAHFSGVMKDPLKMAHFVESANKVVDRFGFDGVDIDWEYPGKEGNTKDFDPNDWKNMAMMLKAFRDSWKGNSKECYTLSICLAGFSSETTTPGFAPEAKSISAQVDYMNIMAYDFQYGVAFAWHGSALKSKPSGDEDVKLGTVENAYKSYGELNLPNFVIGLPSYGVKFEMKEPVADKKCLRKPAGSTSAVDFRELQTLIANPGFSLTRDPDHGTSYICNGTTFVSFDTPEDTVAKANWVLDKKNLAGIMYWEIAQDLPPSDPKSTLGAISTVFKVDTTPIRKSACIADSEFCNLRCSGSSDPQKPKETAVDNATEAPKGPKAAASLLADDATFDSQSTISLSARKCGSRVKRPSPDAVASDKLSEDEDFDLRYVQ